jgi:hypothetical protein
MRNKITAAYTPEQKLGKAYTDIVQDAKHRENVELAKETILRIARETHSVPDDEDASRDRK